MKKIGFLLSNVCLPFLAVVIFLSSCSKNDMDFDYGQVSEH
jgi:branched-subunit amino acid permease